MYNYNASARFVRARSIVCCENFWQITQRLPGNCIGGGKQFSWASRAGAPFSLARPVLSCVHYFYAGYSVIDIINELNRTIATRPLLTCALFLLFFFQVLVRVERTFWVVSLLHVQCSMFVSSSTQPGFHSGLLELLLFCLGTIPPVCTQSLVDKTLTPSPWTTHMDYRKIDYAAEV